ncbi:hypothetical protein CDD83_8916 [Cordyceps sp. RAO-2017]|nr:hypothetical protein CDD83_8916 [Cordyceps sp. RAO-2017]
MSFTSIPVLDLELARNAATKGEFLAQLRHALLEVGFLYLKNTGIPAALVDDVVDKGKAFFDLPLEEKYGPPGKVGGGGAEQRAA